MNNKELYKQIPSVDEIINNLPKDLLLLHRNLIKQIIHNSINDIKKQITNGELNTDVSRYLRGLILERLNRASKPHLNKVINGTGIVLHTGLGRAPISKKIFNKALDSIYPYTNLEFNLSNGKRGERNHHVDYLLNSITGSESSIVVNNNAAAVLLTLNTLAENEKVIISRGQQVEIGGSFRIPDVINKSNCNMIEVGTTNKTHLKDYQQAINDNSGVILYAHTSNYKVVGFTEEVSLIDLGKLSKKNRIPLVVDLGSGALLDFSKMNLPFENLVSHYIKAGSSIVTFSGDKLIGGPQCGIICGKKGLIKKIQNNPLYRALRCDKFTLSLLEHSLKTFISDSNFNSENLVISLLNRDRGTLEKMGNKILNKIDKKIINKNNIELIPSNVEAGSGSLPTKNIESCAISIQSEIKPMLLSQKFRSASIPIIGYINKGTFFIDLKAITADQAQLVSDIIVEVLS
tara:strand:- start:194 stop:1576 length:1383 start_codon:yes stop_codon:yes gene_type:complete